MHLTRKERDDKYDSNQLRTEPWRPNQDDRRMSKMLWSMVSKACRAVKETEKSAKFRVMDNVTEGGTLTIEHIPEFP